MSSAYLFLELAILVYLIGFCWEHIDFVELRRAYLWKPALALACFWFVIDQVAVRLGLWTFPDTGTLKFRLLLLPFEEYVLFFLHTVVCFVLLRQYGPTNR